MKLSTLICLSLLMLTSANGFSMESIRLSQDGKSFVTHPSGKTFTPYGFNYAPRNEVLEEHWDNHWDEIAGDFREMKDLGANVVRIHLQFNHFLPVQDQPNSHSLKKLGEVVALAEKTGLYLDITGLACYRPNSAPEWYDELDEAGRWKAQAFFWSTIAETCSVSPAIFCYDLMNEPIVPGEKRKPGQWYSGNLFGGFDFVQFISLDAGTRPRDIVARNWVRQLSISIRTHDKVHLITVGMLPWDKKYRHLSGFVPETVAPELSFISVHIYPEKENVADAIEGLKKFAVGKPVVIEELFPLYCSSTTLKKFILQSRGTAHGWIGHYFGKDEKTLTSELNAETSMSTALMLDWLRMFRETGREVKAP